MESLIPCCDKKKAPDPLLRRPKAMQILLGGDVTTDAGRADVFKACLVAQAVSPETFQSTVRHAAMQFIASEGLDEATSIPNNPLK